jgi:rhombotin-1/3
LQLLTAIFFSSSRFCVGDKFYLCENKILCEYDYEERLVFASMANHPILKRHAGSLQQQQQQHQQQGHNGQHHPPPNGLLMGNGGGVHMIGRNGLNGGSSHVGDHNNNQNGPSNNNGPSNGGGGGGVNALSINIGSSPFGAAHMKQVLGTSS